MGSRIIKRELLELISRKGITQVTLANGTFRGKTTINGYVRGDPAPLEAVEDIANYANDSIFNQQMSFKIFYQLPPMQSDVYQDNPHALDMLELYESEERRIKKSKAMLALAKHPEAMTDEEREAIVDYAVNYLDEVLIEMKCIESIFGKVDMSIMDGIKMRTPYWKKQKYMKGE